MAPTTEGRGGVEATRGATGRLWEGWNVVSDEFAWRSRHTSTMAWNAVFSEASMTNRTFMTTDFG